MKTLLLPALLLAHALTGSPASAQFTVGDLFISSSVTDEVLLFDTNTLDFKSAFSHPEFVVPGGFPYDRGPNGMSFNDRGNLVVAAYATFVEFSGPGVEFAVYPKMTVEATENIVFDRDGNLYTTTATGGSNQLNQYRASDYSFSQTLALPPGAGQLTGIVFDSQDRLFVASQSDARIHVLQADATYTTFTLSHSIASVNGGGLEGLAISRNGELIAAGGDLGRYDRDTGAPLGSFDAPGDVFPVPVQTDNLGNIYVADFENGTGSAPADLIRFTPDGSCYVSRNNPQLWGPFGITIAGGTSSPGIDYCYGTDVAACPCGNPSGGCGGCSNSVGGGALLQAFGTASAGADDLELRVQNVPINQSGVLYMGAGAVSLPFGDGLRCVGAGGVGIFRYPIQSSGGTGALQLGPGIVGHSQVSFGASGGIDPGETWNFQGWFRDPSGPCGFAFNTSNAMSITFSL